MLSSINDEIKLNWASYEEREHFVFVGNFFHQPNVDAVLQLKKLWKFIRKQLPKAEVHVYGAYVSQQIHQLHKPEEGFIIKGFAEDALEVVKKARVVLAPIRFGAGIKGKLTEAMLCGRRPIALLAPGAAGWGSNKCYYKKVHFQHRLELLHQQCHPPCCICSISQAVLLFVFC